MRAIICFIIYFIDFSTSGWYNNYRKHRLKCGSFRAYARQRIFGADCCILRLFKRRFAARNRTCRGHTVGKAPRRHSAITLSAAPRFCLQPYPKYSIERCRDLAPRLNALDARTADWFPTYTALFRARIPVKTCIRLRSQKQDGRVPYSRHKSAFYLFFRLFHGFSPQFVSVCQQMEKYGSSGAKNKNARHTTNINILKGNKHG